MDCEKVDVSLVNVASMPLLPGDFRPSSALDKPHHQIAGRRIRRFDQRLHCVH
jgi:hypothetical protein